MDFKFLISIFAVGLTFVGYFSYFKDILAKKSKPHSYTWLIWALTQGTAAVALIYGGGKFGSLVLVEGTVLVSAVFLLSLKYGTKDITTSDRIALFSALLAIVFWWQTKNPLLAVLMISTIDGLGYFPTIRKTFKDPWSEEIFFWVVMVVADLLALAANAQYNFLTSAYLGTLFVANTTVLSVCVFRRKIIRKTRS
jgi:hypothetical protein